MSRFERIHFSPSVSFAGDKVVCCDELPSDLKGVAVRSAGWADGNRAEFWMNLVAVEVSSDQIKSPWCFNFRT